MCELCELCELFVKTLLYCTLRVAAAESDETIPPLSRWDFLIYPQNCLRDLAKSLLTKPHERYRATSSASRRGLRGLETRLL